MPYVMMTLGQYRFSIDTAAYQTLQRRTEWRWPAQERLGRAPALQYLGPGSDVITLAGVIFPHYRGGLGQMDAIRAQAGQGIPHLLTSGLGIVLGRFVIQSVNETQSLFIAEGLARRVEFTVELAAFGDDGDAGSAAKVEPKRDETKSIGGAKTTAARSPARARGAATRPRSVTELYDGP